MRKITLLLLTALALGIAAPAFASRDDEISSFDRTRLSRLEESKARARVALATASPHDAAAIQRLIDPEGRPVSERELAGTWRCRFIKVGRLAPDMLYSWFNCRVRHTANGLFFEKVSGTWRISGYLNPYQDGRFVLLGATTVKDEPQIPYSGGNDGYGAPTTSSDAVGVVSSIGPRHLRIEFPFPVLESVFDVLELDR